MNIKVLHFEDMWQHVKNSAMTTINKSSGKYPDDTWKRQMLLSEHSPIRLGHFLIRMEGIPSFVSTHLVRHKYGVEHFVSTNRDDRNDKSNGSANINRTSPVNHVISANYQGIINISRRRLCNKAHPSTTKVWQMVLDEIKYFDPVLYSVCVPECIYRGGCYELSTCGYAETFEYDKNLVLYSL